MFVQFETLFTMAEVYLLIGGNEGDRESNISKTRDFIAERIGIVSECSSIYESEPWGFSCEQNFLNQALMVETSLNPAALLMEVSYIENRLGRARKHGVEGYQSRTVDIDIIFYDHTIIFTPDLVIPHRHLHERSFVLEPLCEIAPDYVHPLLSLTVECLAKKCTDRGKVWLYQQGVCVG